MFAVPSLPAPKKQAEVKPVAKPKTVQEAKPVVRMMFTTDEISDLMGKQRNLTRLLENPNAQHPSFTYPLSHLVFSLDATLAWKGHIFEPGVRANLDHSLKCVQILENIMIRAIIQGADYWNLINEEIAKPGEEFLVYFQMHESGRSLSDENTV